MKIKKSFTLIEVIIVSGIIMIFTSLTVVFFKVGEDQIALSRSAYRLAQEVRAAENMALSAKEFHGSVPLSYGLYFVKDAHSYILFADIYPPGTGNNQYDANQGEKVSEISLERKVKISNIPSNPLTITFTPPDPTIYISSGSDEVSIELSLETNPTKTRTVTLNKAGLIEVK